MQPETIAVSGKKRREKSMIGSFTQSIGTNSLWAFYVIIEELLNQPLVTPGK